MRLHQHHREALQRMRLWAASRLGIEGVGIGRKVTRGQATDEICVVVLVKEKLPADQVNSGEVVPDDAGGGLRTDVQESGEIVALGAADVVPQDLTARRDPVDGGWSVGHPDITAGTLGGWCRWGDTDAPHILSNNHVLANVNEASLGDRIMQPGRVDGGIPGPNFDITILRAFADIRFSPPVGKKPSRASRALSRAWWRSGQAVLNAGARATGCDYRLPAPVEARSISQPFPNLVDAAVAEWIEGSRPIMETIYGIGEVSGIGDVELGDAVEKTGRTTEHTTGEVIGVAFSIRVNMGDGRVAPFDDQIRIAPDGFSAGGDSGSWIVKDGRFVGLLFAGGAGETFANTAANVVAVLGVRV